jgi:hypothetical protein
MGSFTLSETTQQTLFKTQLGYRETYKAITYDIVLEKYSGCHLRVFVIVVLDEILICHTVLLLDEHTDFGNFSKA